MTKYFPILALFVLVAFYWSLINKTFSQDSQGNFRAASAGYGDIPFHMTQVSKFAFQKNIDFVEPIYDGERLRYAFGINFISGQILRYTLNWPLAMHLPAMGFMVAGILLTFFAYRSFLKSPVGAVTAIIIFLLGSGFGTSYLTRDYSQNWASETESFFDYLVETTASTVTKWDAVYPDQNIAWGAPLSLVFLHQRAFFLGFFMFSLFWYLLLRFLKNPSSWRLPIFLGLVAGLTPLAHYHSFIAMMVVLAVVFVHGIITRKIDFVRRLVFAGLLIFVLATPQILYLAKGKNQLIFSPDSFIEFRLGWMSQPTIGSIQFGSGGSAIFGQTAPFLNFLWINFGVVLPMFLFTIIIFLKSGRFRERFGGAQVLFLAAIVLFLSVQLVKFQPWDYDNNKVLVYFQFFAAPVIVAFFMWISIYRKHAGWILLAAFTVVAIHSGIVDQIPRLAVATSNTPIIFNKDAIMLADFIKDSIPQDKKIITTSTHLNPVASLAGRPVYVGYPGWLWTRGIDYAQREQRVREFYADPKSNKSRPYFNEAQYVLLDPIAIYEWRASVETFDEQFDRIFTNGSYSLYKLRW